MEPSVWPSDEPSEDPSVGPSVETGMNYYEWWRLKSLVAKYSLKESWPHWDWEIETDRRWEPPKPDSSYRLIVVECQHLHWFSWDPKPKRNFFKKVIDKLMQLT